MTLFTAVLLGQITSIELREIVVRPDSVYVTFEDEPCGQTARRRVVVTNDGTDTIHLWTGSVSGLRFSGGFIHLGIATKTKPQTSQDIELVHVGLQPHVKDKGYVDVQASYAEEAIDQERKRIEAQARKAIDEVRLDMRDIEDEGREDLTEAAEKGQEIRSRHGKNSTRIDDKLFTSRQQIRRLRDQYEERRTEYLAGFFCSGCGKTRSEIEGKGETFPHSGQTVRGATPEQLAKLKREYDQMIAAEVANSEQLKRELERIEQAMTSELTALEHKMLRLKELRDKHLAKLGEELRSLEDRRRELLAELITYSKKRVQTRIEIFGQCAKAQ